MSTFERLWRNRWLTAEAKTIADMVHLGAEESLGWNPKHIPSK